MCIRDRLRIVWSCTSNTFARWSICIIKHKLVGFLYIVVLYAAQIRTGNVRRTEIAMKGSWQKSRTLTTKNQGFDDVITNLGQKHIQKNQLGTESIPKCRA